MKDSALGGIVVSMCVIVVAASFYMSTGARWCKSARFDYDTVQLCIVTRGCVTNAGNMERIRKFETRCFRKPGVE